MSFARGIGGRASGRRLLQGVVTGGAGFSGNFGALFTGVIQYLRTDLGLVEFATLYHTAGSGPAITFSGTRSGVAVPIWVTCTLGGALGVWTGSVSYDEGSTQSQTFTSAATVALTGAGAGLTLNIVGGTAVLADVWKATASTLADQSGGGINVAAGGTSGFGLITKGLTSHAGVASDNVAGALYGTNALPAFPVPTTTPTFYWAVMRMLGASAAVGAVWSDGTSRFQCYQNASTNLNMFNSSTVGPTTAVAGSWGRLEESFVGTTSSYIKFGSAAAAVGDCGNNAGNLNQGIFAQPGGSNAAFTEILCRVVLNNVPSGAQLAAAAAAAQSFYGGTVAI